MDGRKVSNKNNVGSVATKRKSVSFRDLPPYGSISVSRAVLTHVDKAMDSIGPSSHLFSSQSGKESFFSVFLFSFS